MMGSDGLSLILVIYQDSFLESYPTAMAIVFRPFVFVVVDKGIGGIACFILNCMLRNNIHIILHGHDGIRRVQG